MALDLGQETRAAAFGLLLETGRAVSAGQIAAELNAAPSAVEAELRRLDAAGRIRLSAEGHVLGSAGLSAAPAAHELWLGARPFLTSGAYKVRQAGWSVAVIDSRPFGGTCQLRGCDPKRVLVGVSELMDWSRRMQGKGVSAPALSMNWPDMIRFKRTFTDAAPEENAKAFAQAGILARHGRAHFVDRRTVEVEGQTLVGR